jgi:hypothetical protein
MKAAASPTPEIFLSTIFLSNLGIGTGKFWTGKFLEPDVCLRNCRFGCILFGSALALRSSPAAYLQKNLSLPNSLIRLKRVYGPDTINRIPHDAAHFGGQISRRFHGKVRRAFPNFDPGQSGFAGDRSRVD